MRSFKKPSAQRLGKKTSRPPRRQMPIKEIIARLDEAVTRELAADSQEPETATDDNRQTDD